MTQSRKVPVVGGIVEGASNEESEMTENLEAFFVVKIHSRIKRSRFVRSEGFYILNYMGVENRAPKLRGTLKL